MGIFGPRHDILELPTVPREKGKLAAIIGTARHQKRKRTLMRGASFLMILVAVMLLMQLRGGSAAPTYPPGRTIFLPVVAIGRMIEADQ